jgi:hypothetical protein
MAELVTENVSYKSSMARNLKVYSTGSVFREEGKLRESKKEVYVVFLSIHIRLRSASPVLEPKTDASVDDFSIEAVHRNVYAATPPWKLQAESSDVVLLRISFTTFKFFSAKNNTEQTGTQRTGCEWQERKKSLPRSKHSTKQLACLSPTERENGAQQWAPPLSPCFFVSCSMSNPG